jgi:hypothetical protein
MEPWYPFVIGTIAFFYIHSFNRNARMYLESEKTLSWRDFFTKVIPISESGVRTHAL